jgi:regulator of protease activity HflC (stomatin/prohibitin superfamily)
MEAAKAEAEAARIKQVAQAKAEAESQIERAKGLAASRQILAQSFQENIETISSTGANVSEVMDLLMTVNKLETMKDIGNNGNLVVMDSMNSGLATQAKMLKEIEKNA